MFQYHNIPEMYSSLIVATLVPQTFRFSAEIQAETPKTKQLLETTETNSLRKIVGKRRLAHVTNEDTTMRNPANRRMDFKGATR
jgi:hypothetical protein